MKQFKDCFVNKSLSLMIFSWMRHNAVLLSWYFSIPSALILFNTSLLNLIIFKVWICYHFAFSHFAVVKGLIFHFHLFWPLSNMTNNSDFSLTQQLMSQTRIYIFGCFVTSIFWYVVQQIFSGNFDFKTLVTLIWVRKRHICLGPANYSSNRRRLEQP